MHEIENVLLLTNRNSLSHSWSTSLGTSGRLLVVVLVLVVQKVAQYVTVRGNESIIFPNGSVWQVINQSNMHHLLIRKA